MEGKPNSLSLEGDHYTCPRCTSIPEIVSIHSDSGYIDLRCPEPTHNFLSHHITEYIKGESQYSNDKVKCGFCQKDATIIGINLFSYCYDCHKDVCPNCAKSNKEHKNHKKIIPLKAKCEKCLEHFDEGDFKRFCFNCYESICEKEKFRHQNHEIKNIEELKKLAKDKIKTIKKKNNLLDIIRFFNNILIKTFTLFPNNALHCKSIINVADSYEKEMSRDSLKLNSLLDNLEAKFNYQEKALKELSNKIKKKITGLETQLILSDYNLDDKDLENISNIQFPNLKYADFGYNNIENISSFQFIYAPLLQNVNFEHNKINKIDAIKQVKKNCPHLTNLDFRDNKIKDIKILNDEIFRSIEKIILFNNDINYEIAENKDVLKSLGEKIKYKAITKEDFKRKYKCNTVDFNNKTTLYLNDTKIGNEGLESLFLLNYDFTKLQKLFLSTCKISNINILGKQRLKNLNELDLTGNNIKDISIFKEVNFPELEILRLDKNQFQYITVFQPLIFKKLKKLEVNSTQIVNSNKNKTVVKYLRENKVEVSINLEV